MRLRLSSLLALSVIAVACGGESDDAATSSAADVAVADGGDAPAPTDDESTATADEAPPIAASFGGSTMTGAELTTFTAAIGSNDERGALGLWLVTLAIEEDLAATGRPLSELDLADSELALSANVPDPDPRLVRVNAVLTLSRSIAEETAAAEVDPTDVPEVLCSSHILLETETEAAEVATLAQSGDDFAELAMTYSTGPTGPTGGDLGCVPTSSFVTEFVDGARDNGPGVTEPVESPFGWHVILVRSIGPGTREIHPELTDADALALLDGQIEVAVGVYLDQLAATASARIGAEADIDPAYGVWDVATAQLVDG